MKKWMAMWTALFFSGTGAGAAELLIESSNSTGQLVSDGPAMVQIPTGINTGTDPDFGTYSLTNASPLHMDKYEVTNDEMMRVMQWAYDDGRLSVSTSSVQNATGCVQELLDLDDSDCRITWDGLEFGLKAGNSTNYPCVEATWYGAAAYCNYRSEMGGKTACYNLLDWSCNFEANGYRLPTNEEWEYAARGGLSDQRFPWGETITHSNANYNSSTFYGYDTSTTRGCYPDDPGVGRLCTRPVTDFAANGYGLHNMAGNVWEWCWDADGPYRYIRGGGWNDDADSARCGGSSWNNPTYGSSRIGFRATCRAGSRSVDRENHIDEGGRL